MSEINDNFLIDSHKLMFHPERVSCWLRGEDIYPIYVEVSPTNACNHRCIFCAYSYLGYEPYYLSRIVINRRLEEMGKLGVKSVMFSGEGEPLLHKHINDMISAAYSAGIDVAITTNGVYLDRLTTLDKITWIKVSIDAATPQTYARIHGCSDKDFDVVIKNIKKVVKERNDNGYKCTIGAQMLLLKDNEHEVEHLSNILKDMGVDYFVVKPYSPHAMNDIVVDAVSDINNIAVPWGVLRKDTFKRVQQNKEYDECYAQDFWCHIDSRGNVYACSAYLGDERYIYGNINKNTFATIWSKHKNVHIDVSQCRRACRMDKCNTYLWKLKTQSVRHINFI